MGGVVVKALQYLSEGPGIDPRSLAILSGASDSSMCPGFDSVSKNEYQDFPGVKYGRCVRMMTLPPSRNSGALTFWYPSFTFKF
jgi:hypothetical protein